MNIHEDSESTDMASLTMEPAGWYKTTIPGVGGSVCGSTSSRGSTGSRGSTSTRHQQKSGKSDKMLRSPFGVFMTEQRPLFENDGVTFSQGWKSVADFLTPKWAELPEEEKSRYRKMSEVLRGCSASVDFNAPPPPKPQPKPNPPDDKMGTKIAKMRSGPSGYTTFGENIISAPAEVLIEYREYYKVRAKIESFLHMDLGEQPRPLEEKTIVVIEFNPYCMDTDGSGDVVPAEWSMVTFSIKSGIKSVSCGLIDPGTTPMGTGSEVKESIKSMGLRPIGFNKESRGSDVEDETATETEPEEFQGIVNDINDMLMLNHREFYKRGYVFSMRDNVSIVKRCLKWLCKKSGENIEFEVLPLSVLMEMYSAISPLGTFNSRTEVESDRLLKKVTFAYEESLSCDWHLAKERMNLLDKCARNMAQRAVFNMLDYLCPIYGVEATVPEHRPVAQLNVTNPWTQDFFNMHIQGEEWLRRPMSVYSICSDDSFLSASLSNVTVRDDPPASPIPSSSEFSVISSPSDLASSTD